MLSSKMVRNRRFLCLAAIAAGAASPIAMLSAQSRSVEFKAPTEAEIAASPAAKRLVELIEVVNTGDAALMRAYVEKNGVQAPAPAPAGRRGKPLLASVLDLHRRSRGLKLVRIEAVHDNVAAATVRNSLLQREQTLAVQVEPQAPNRISALPAIQIDMTGSEPAAKPSAPQGEAEQLREIRNYLERLAAADVFSGVVVVAREGKPVLSQAYGLADRAKRIPNKQETPFLLGSMNKLFTSLAIGRLVEQGKLSYEDPLAKFIPDFPDPAAAGKIRIKHLLSHTSGLGSYFNPTFFKSLDRLRDVQSVLAVAGRDAPAFEPGSRWRYSNTGFLLLGRIIEIVSGQDYYEYMRKNVFIPAGMTATGFPHYDREVAVMALPYELELRGDGLDYVDQLPTSPKRGTPAGGGISTAADLLKLASAIRSGKILKPETYRLHASAKPELGSPNYGYGFALSPRVAGRKIVGHGGNAPGQCTEFAMVNDTAVPYTVVILSNVTEDTCINVTEKIYNSLAPIQ